MRALWAIVGLTALAGIGSDQDPAMNRANNVLSDVGGTHIKIGDRIKDFSVKDVSGKTVSLAALRQKGPVAVVFMGTACPVAQRYTVRLNQISAEYGKKGVSVVALFSNSEDTAQAVAKHSKEMGYKFIAAKDERSSLAKQMGATMTPQAYLIGKNGVLLYRGAIDDNRYETRVAKRYLKDALDQALAGKSVKVAEAAAFGCTIHFPDEVSDDGVTYYSQVAAIIQAKCQPCHRPGQVAPFHLMNYADAKQWAAEIKEYTQKRLMPPWKPEPGFGEFLGNRSLTEEEIRTIAEWVDHGAPAGDPNAAPPARPYAGEWNLGKPDFVVEMPEEFEVGPTGEDEYRHFVIPTKFDKDVFINAVDVMPGNPRTVHHVILYVDVSGSGRRLDARDPGPGYSAFGWPGFMPAGTLGGWAPGFTPTTLPSNSGYLLPKGADIVMQVHYYRTGKTERDRSKVGLYFTKTPSPKVVRVAPAIDFRFRIPPGAKNHIVTAQWTAPQDVDLVAITPHMHLIGKSMKVTAKAPNSDKEIPLIYIKDWDFKWQDTYRYKENIRLPKGTVVTASAVYDNSADNPRNPSNPPKWVGWGEKTTDEMCIAFLHMMAADGKDLSGVEQFGGLETQPGGRRE
ncbi:MAG: redoxin family protein [Armatimonadetes bacterium]|nr:redoxin family protein [Armatimonadota bacterium]